MTDNCSVVMDEKLQSSNQGPELIKKDRETTPNVDNIPFMTNFYITSKHKKISARLKKLDKHTTIVRQETQNLINTAKETYSTDYVKCIILIAKNNSKLLGNFELSEEKEMDTLKAISKLDKIDDGIDEGDLARLRDAIEFVFDLEDRLYRKGLLKKMPLSLRLTNQISKEGGETK